MKKNKLFQRLIWAGSALLIGPSALADFSWSGQYRIEGQQIFNGSLDREKNEKTYAIHHFVLNPKVVLADGVNVFGRFDIFNSAMYPDSIMGEHFGAGRTGTNSQTLGTTQEPETLDVTNLYLNFVNEYGVLIAGRAPLQFGLGMTYSAGRGAFDHWQDTRDLIGYKMVIGNFTLMPAYAKFNEGDLADPKDDISSLIVQFEYESPENDVQMGLMYEARDASVGGNDAATDLGGTNNDKFDIDNFNVFFHRQFTNLAVGFEAGFTNGETGVLSGSNEKVDMTGFGLATEIEYAPKEKSWSAALNLGYATGDDPTTTDSFEGYIFNRNYDVGFLLFNYAIGTNDIFGTNSLIDSQAGLALGKQNSMDVEAISNVTYLAPRYDYKWSDKWSSGFGLVWATLVNTKFGAGELGSDVGMELDLSLTYKPNDRVQWVNEIGYLTPGSAFKGIDTAPLDASAAYGFRSKAAISF